MANINLIYINIISIKTVGIFSRITSYSCKNNLGVLSEFLGELKIAGQFKSKRNLRIDFLLGEVILLVKGEIKGGIANVGMFFSDL